MTNGLSQLTPTDQIAYWLHLTRAARSEFPGEVLRYMEFAPPVGMLSDYFLVRQIGPRDDPRQLFIRRVVGRAELLAAAERDPDVGLLREVFARRVRQAGATGAVGEKLDCGRLVVKRLSYEPEGQRLLRLATFFPKTAGSTVGLPTEIELFASNLVTHVDGAVVGQLRSDEIYQVVAPEKLSGERLPVCRARGDLPPSVVISDGIKDYLGIKGKGRPRVYLATYAADREVIAKGMTRRVQDLGQAAKMADRLTCSFGPPCMRVGLAMLMRPGGQLFAEVSILAIAIFLSEAV